MENNKQRNKPRRPFAARRDILILLAVLLLAGLVWLAVQGGGQGMVAVATIGTGEGQREQAIPLDKDGVWVIEDGALPVHLEVTDGAVRFIDSVCPDHRCEHFGWLRQEGDWAACLPAQVTLRIEAS